MTGSWPLERAATGVVISFDDRRGIGVVSVDDSEDELGFHCTAIADGTRTIEVGTPVAFEVVAGHLGRLEATAIRPTRPSRPAARA